MRTVITESVPCVFGPGGRHEVTITLNDKYMLEDIKCGCDAEREETEGLILLGTNEMSTCLGQRNTFLKHIKGESEYRLAREYQASAILFRVGSLVQSNVANLRRQRELEQQELQKRAQEEAENDHVTLRLNGIIRETIGEEPASVVSIVRRERNGQPMYVLGVRGERQYPNPRGQLRTAAFRVQGEWLFRENYMRQAWTSTVGSWGGHCAVCQGEGYRDHNGTKKHEKIIEKTIMLAAQATSGEGVRLAKADSEYEFTYRKNKKHIPGVRIVSEDEWNTLWQETGGK